MSNFGIREDAFRANDGRFHSKLTHDERCAILALLTARVRRDVIARAYGVNLRTLVHFGPNSNKYKKVKEEQIGLGVDEFAKKYITEAVTKRVNDAMKEEPAPESANKRRNQYEGKHTIENEFLSAPRDIYIDWQDTGVLGPGWYFSLDRLYWFHNGPESIVTSKACYEAVKANLTDD